MCLKMRKTVCELTREYRLTHFHAVECLESMRRDQVGPEILQQLELLLEQLQDLAVTLHQRSSAMEQRLRRYRQSIEALGFVRNRP